MLLSECHESRRRGFTNLYPVAMRTDNRVAKVMKHKERLLPPDAYGQRIVADAATILHCPPHSDRAVKVQLALREAHGGPKHGFRKLALPEGVCREVYGSAERRHVQKQHADPNVGLGLGLSLARQIAEEPEGARGYLAPTARRTLSTDIAQQKMAGRNT